MNWVISKSKLLSCHTLLNEVLKPLRDDISGLQWLISDLEYSEEFHRDLPLDMDTDYFVLPPIEFTKVLEQKYVQIIWGVFVGIPNNIPINVDVIPSAEFNEQVWKNGTCNIRML